MKTTFENRFYRIVFFAALALVFWIFDFTVLAWICGSLVILPFVIGFFLWLCDGKWQYKK